MHLLRSDVRHAHNIDRGKATLNLPLPLPVFRYSVPEGMMMYDVRRKASDTLGWMNFQAEILDDGNCSSAVRDNLWDSPVLATWGSGSIVSTLNMPGLYGFRAASLDVLYEVLIVLTPRDTSMQICQNVSWSLPFSLRVFPFGEIRLENWKFIRGGAVI